LKGEMNLLLDIALKTQKQEKNRKQMLSSASRRSISALG
jgi:hypothetical protein